MSPVSTGPVAGSGSAATNTPDGVGGSPPGATRERPRRAEGRGDDESGGPRDITGHEPHRRRTTARRPRLQRVYGRGPTAFEALRGVDLEIRQGECVAIVGKSGSGKSTLMHLLALLDRPSGGTVLLDGRDTRTLRGRELNRARNKTFGFVFQQFFLTPGQSTLENVSLPLKIAGVSRRLRRDRARASLDQLELGDKARSRAVDLSGGQKQRAAIARALVTGPRIIFADEPTGNLDSVTGSLVEDILFSLNRDRGITLVIVTHDEDLAARCDRRIHVRDGLVVAPGSP